MIRVSPSPLSPQGHCGVHPSFPECFAADWQLFITTGWLASANCPTVNNCCYIKAPQSYMQAHPQPCLRTWREESCTRNRCVFFFFLEPVAHRVIERWQIRFYPFRRSLLCNPLAQQQTRLVMVLFDTLFPLHGWLKNYHCFLETALVMLHCFLLMELYGEKINAEEPPVFRESTHTKIKTLCAFKQGVFWASITYWTSHPCSVGMEMGHCCWSHSWHRHSERTKWMHLQKK